MSIVLKEITVSDEMQDFVDKVNFNFDQIKLNGGGLRGLPGKDSTVKGIPGIRGSAWYYGEGDPNIITMADALEGDLFLSDNGDIWECTDGVLFTWTQTPINIKGEKGETGDDATGLFTIRDGTTEHFLYVAPENIGTGATDIRSFLFGGYPETGGHNLNSDLVENLHAGDSIMYLYSPATGIKQLKFLYADSTDTNLVPSIFSMSNDVLVIENPRLVTQNTVLDGIRLIADDTNVFINSLREINLFADATPTGVTPVGNDNIGNINIKSLDLAGNGFPDSSEILIENRLFDTNQAAYISLKADSHAGGKYIYMKSDYYNSDLTIAQDFLVNARYFRLNNTQTINEISNDGTLASNSARALVSERAIKLYVDNTESNLQSNLDAHINDTGASHTYINQSVTTTATPQFTDVRIGGQNNKVKLNGSGYLELVSSGAHLMIGGTTTTMRINAYEPENNSPNRFIFNNGSTSSYATLVHNDSVVYGDVTLVGGGWIDSAEGNQLGMYLNTNGTVKFSVLSGSGTRIAMFNSSNYIYAQAPNTAFNKNYGTGTDNIVKIGATLGNSLMTGTNSSGQLITIDAATARTRIGLTSSNTSTHYHDQRYIRRDTSTTFTGKISVGSTSSRSSGMYGIYDSTKTGHIWSMGTAYKISDTGVNFGNLYGLAYKHTNNTTGGSMAGGHQAVFVNNGTAGAAVGFAGNFWTSGVFISTKATGTAPLTVASSTKVTNLNADYLDGYDITQIIRTNQASQTIDGGTSTTLTLLSNDNGASRLNLYGSSQGTGMLYVGQSSTYGGGIEYNGDNSPSTTGAGADQTALYRVNNGVYTWTAKNSVSDNHWHFRGNVYSPTFVENGTTLANKYLGKTAKAVDADKLDGINSTQFARSDANDTITGNYYFNGKTPYTGGANLKHFFNPGGGYYNSNSSSVAGYLKITLPVSWSNHMMRFTIDIYEYAGGSNGTSVTLNVGGYNYTGDGNWHNYFAQVISGRSDRFYNVRFGHDGSKCYVAIADSRNWAYPKVVVRSVSIGYSTVDGNTWASGWSVGIVSSLSGVKRTVPATLVASHSLGADYATSAGNADTVDGYRAGAYNSTSGSTLVTRNSSGYIFTNYFNMSANDTTSTAQRLVVRTGSDTYLRWQTPASFISNHGIAKLSDFTGTGSANRVHWNKVYGKPTMLHDDTSSQSDSYNSGGTVIQDVNLDGYGHVQGLGTVNLDDRYPQYKAGYSKSGGSAGWYTIARVTSRGSALFVLYDTSSGNHQSVHFYASHMFNKTNIVVLNNAHYASDSDVPIQKLRIRTNSSIYGEAILQAYIEASTTLNFKILESYIPSGWTAVNWSTSLYSTSDTRAHVYLTQPTQGIISYDDMFAGYNGYAGNSSVGGYGRVLTTYNKEHRDPFIKLAGRISSTGSRSDWWGERRVSGSPFSSSRLSTGKYRITHNLESSIYGFVGVGTHNNNMKASMYSRNSNYCDVGVSDDSSLNDASFSFIIFKLH